MKSPRKSKREEEAAEIQAIILSALSRVISFRDLRYVNMSLVSNCNKLWKYLYFIQFSIREASKAMGWWDNPPTGMKVIAPVNMQQFYAKVIDKNISID